MGEKKEYRSAVRSRRMIREAFMELVYEKKNGKVTVTDIVNRADINRSTFYAHYPDVQGIVEEIESEIIENSKPTFDMTYLNVLEDPRPFLESLSKMFEQNQELYRVLAKSNYVTHFEKTISDYLTDFLLHSEGVPDVIKESPFFDLGLTFTMGGIARVFDKWVQGNLDYTIDDMVKEMEKMIVAFSGVTLKLGWGITVDVPKKEQ